MGVDTKSGPMIQNALAELGGLGEQISDAINPTCFATTTVFVPQPPTALVVTSSSVPVTCFGFSDGQALVFATGGLPFAGPNPYTYEWTDGTNILGTSSILVAQAGTFFCSLTDDANCVVAINFLTRILLTGSVLPVTFATKGIVLLALGFTSIK